MKIFKTNFWITAVFSCLLIQFSASYFYTNYFTVAPGADYDVMNYGMEGLVVAPANQTSTTTIINNTIVFTGVPHQITGLNGSWTGYCLRLTNTYHASAEKPFGFEFYRSWSVIDSFCGQAAGRTPERGRNQLDIWLVNNEGVPTGQREYFANTFNLSEQGQFSNYYSGIYPFYSSKWGYKSGTFRYINFSNAIGPFGTTVNLDLGTAGYHKLNFPYYWTAAQNRTNTNSYLLRITHDGSYIRCYINPNPNKDPGNNYKNEYHQIAEAQVFWSSNLNVMFGHEIRNRQMNRQDAAYDYLMIRSVATGSGYYLSPGSFGRGRLAYTLTLTNKVSCTDSGVNTLRLGSTHRLRLESVAVNGTELKRQQVLAALHERAGWVAKDVANYYQSANAADIVLSRFLGNKDIISIAFTVDPEDLKSGLNSRISVHVGGEQYHELPYTYRGASTCGFQRSVGKGNLLRYMPLSFAPVNSRKVLP